MAEKRASELSTSRSIPADVLAKCKAEYAVGLSLPKLAAKYGIAYSSLQYHAQKQGWEQDAELAVQARVREKLAGVSAHDDAIKRDEAVDAEAEKRAEIRRKHRKQWEEIAEMRGKVIKTAPTNTAKAFEDAKLVKILAESTEIMQRGESRAWGLDAKSGVGSSVSGPDGTVILIDRN